MRLEGKVAIITGGARGIGSETARRFVSEGASVVVADRRTDEGKALVRELLELRAGSAEFIELDITQEEAWQSAVSQTVDAFERVDILVNNAGIIRVAPLEKTDLDLFRKVIDTNLVGTFLGLKTVMEPMARSGGGSIVNFSSVQGLEGREGLLAYSASKFGIRGLTKTAAIELGPRGIRVNAVIPGPTKTKMTERKGWSDDDYDAAYGNYPLGRMANASEVAAVVVFLGSDESSFCTGADFVVDGGVSSGKPRS